MSHVGKNSIGIASLFGLTYDGQGWAGAQSFRNYAR